CVTLSSVCSREGVACARDARNLAIPRQPGLAREPPLRPPVACLRLCGGPMAPVRRCVERSKGQPSPGQSVSLRSIQPGGDRFRCSFQSPRRGGGYQLIVVLGSITPRK